MVQSRAWGVRGVLGAYFILGALALVPLMAAPIPPLLDYIDHLARAAVIANRDPGNAMAANYVVHWKIIPNLAFDLVVPALARLMPIELAGRLFLALAMLSMAAGTLALQRVLYGRVGLWPLASFLFLYNGLVLVGFVPVLFTLGVATLAFSLWIASARWRTAPRLLLFAAIAALLLLLHLFAFGYYGLLIAGYEAGRLWEERPRRAQLPARSAFLLQFVPALGLWAASLGNMGLPYTAQGSIARKLAVWVFAIAFNDPPTASDLLLLVLVIGFLVSALATRTLRLAPAMRAPVAVLALAAFLMPEWVSGSWGADLRLPAALPFIVIGGSRIDPRAAPRMLVTFAAAALGFFAVRIVAITMDWRFLDAEIAEFRAAIRTLPEGARIMTVQGTLPPDFGTLPGLSVLVQHVDPNALWHLDTLAVMDRGAFATDLFTTNTPVAASPRNAGLSRVYWGPLTVKEFLEREGPPQGDPAKLREKYDGLIPCCYDWPHVYDFVLWFDFGHPPANLPPPLMPWAAGSYFHIYKIARP